MSTRRGAADREAAPPGRSPPDRKVAELGAGVSHGPARSRAGDRTGRQAAGRRGRRRSCIRALARGVRRLRGRRRIQGRRPAGPARRRRPSPSGWPAPNTPTSAAPHRAAGRRPGDEPPAARRRGPRPQDAGRGRVVAVAGGRRTGQPLDGPDRPGTPPIGRAVRPTSPPPGHGPVPSRDRSLPRRAARAIPSGGPASAKPRPSHRPTPESALDAECLPAGDPGRVRQPGPDPQRHLGRRDQLVRQPLPARHADPPRPGRLDHVHDRQAGRSGAGSPALAAPVAAADTQITLVDASPFMNGDVLELASGERVEIVADPNIADQRRHRPPRRGGDDRRHRRRQRPDPSDRQQPDRRRDQPERRRHSARSGVTQFCQTWQHPVQVGGSLQASAALPDRARRPHARSTRTRWIALQNLMDDMESSSYYGRGEDPAVAPRPEAEGPADPPDQQQRRPPRPTPAPTSRPT